jgi:hypothetical protein
MAEHGTIQWHDLTKEATMRLYPAKEDDTTEKVIIHELLHIVLKDWDDEKVESAIYHLTSVLFDLTR